MSFQKLSTKCVVMDHEGRVLLSKREDLGIWNLPGGRLDSGELMTDAALREAREETGIIAELERVVGLYHLHGHAISLVCQARPVGGELLQATFETSANAYFAVDALPETLHGIEYINGARAETRPLPQVLRLPTTQYLLTKYVQFPLRYVRNYLSGHPEPRHVRFKVRGVGLVFNAEHSQVLTLNGTHLPAVTADGRKAVWLQLGDFTRQLHPAALTFQFVGLWQDTVSDSLDFVFAARAESATVSKGAAWADVHAPALMNPRENTYIRCTPPDFMSAPVWIIPERADPGKPVP